MYCECEFKAVFEVRLVEATLNIAIYEAAKLPRSSMQWTRKICQINSRSVPLFWSNACEYTTSNVLKSTFSNLQRERKTFSTIDLVKCKISMSRYSVVKLRLLRCHLLGCLQPSLPCGCVTLALYVSHVIQLVVPRLIIYRSGKLAVHLDASLVENVHSGQ